MSKYYLSFVVDAGMPMEGFTIVEANSIGEACYWFCKKHATQLCGELPYSGDNAIMRMRRGELSSINFCFLLPLKLQGVDVLSLKRKFKDMPQRTFARYFSDAWQKIARTGISIEYPEPLQQAVRAAEKPLNPNDAFSRQFKRTFLVWNMLEKLF